MGYPLLLGPGEVVQTIRTVHNLVTVYSKESHLWKGKGVRELARGWKPSNALGFARFLKRSQTERHFDFKEKTTKTISDESLTNDQG